MPPTPCLRTFALFVFFLLRADVSPADDAPFNEAQEAVLKVLDKPFGKPGPYSLHIRFQDSEKGKGERVTWEFWNPKLHMKLTKGDSAQSPADKLNGAVEPLWKGTAVLTADAYRLSLSADASSATGVQYEPWKPLRRPEFFGFWVAKTPEGWKVRGTTSTREFNGPYDHVSSLSENVHSESKAAIQEQEMKAAFADFIQAQSAESLVLVERKISRLDGRNESDKFLEFHRPKIEYELQKASVADALNGNVAIRVNVTHDATRTLKVVKWEREDGVRELEFNKTKPVYPTKWENAGESAGKYYGVRKDGKWMFTLYVGGEAESRNWFGQLILAPKGSWR